MLHRNVSVDMYYVYLLKLSNGSIYTGCTPDLKRRFEEHQIGKAESTKNLRPVTLIWYCAFPSRIQARQFETYLKSGSGQAFRNKRLIENLRRGGRVVDGNSLENCRS